MKLMDVTLRESVYYGSGIDYNEALDYLQKLDSFVTPSEIEYVEICYINTDKQGHLNYNGDYIKSAFDICRGKFKLVGMMHPGSVDISLLDPDAIRLLSMVRIVCGECVIPSSVKDYVKYFHDLGVDVGINISFALKKSYRKNEELCEQCVAYGADYVYFADSSGSAFSDDIDKLCAILHKTKINNQVGLHLHDHMSLSFSNALRAFENSIDITDVSVTGAGRGGGNLKTEFMMPFLKQSRNEKINKDLFDRLLAYIEYFNTLVHRESSLYVHMFLDTLSGIYRLGLKQQEDMERKAKGNGYKYIELVLEEAESEL